MKILIIRNFPSYMAVKNNTYNVQEVGLAKALVRKGHFCDILFWTEDEEEVVTIPLNDSCGIRVYYRHGLTKLKNTIYTKCDELFAKYDVLQPCEYNQIQSWLLAMKYPNKTIIYHGPYYSPFNKRYNLMCKVFDSIFIKYYIKKGTKFLVKSSMAEEFLIKKGILAENIKVVGVGIDAQMLQEKCSECEEKLYIKMKSNLDRLKVLYIGRFEKRRNITFIIDVFEKILQQNRDAELYMIGTGEQQYINEIFRYIDAKKLRDKIVWQERMEQRYLSNVYSLADFFILPTEYEIFGMVMLEAMYYQTIVITTLNGGSSTLIKSGENSFIFECKDSDEWAKCIIDTYDNKTYFCKLKKNAHNKITNEYMWDALVEQFIEQYRNIGR